MTTLQPPFASVEKPPSSVRAWIGATLAQLAASTLFSRHEVFTVYKAIERKQAQPDPSPVESLPEEQHKEQDAVVPPRLQGMPLPPPCEGRAAHMVRDALVPAEAPVAQGQWADTNAVALLEDSKETLGNRASEYDRHKAEERSFPEIARRFNQRTGLNINARQAVVFLQVLKQVRRDTAPGFHRDSFVDEACYIALEALYAAQGMPVKTGKDA